MIGLTRIAYYFYLICFIYFSYSFHFVVHFRYQWFLFPIFMFTIEILAINLIHYLDKIQAAFRVLKLWIFFSNSFTDFIQKFFLIQQPTETFKIFLVFII